MRADPLLERLCAPQAQEPPSTLVVVAHPDDETIGAGARIASISGNCRVVYVTDGAPADRRFVPETFAGMSRAAYARMRRDEAVRSLALAGVDPSHIASLDVRDQEAAFDLVSIAQHLAATIIGMRPAVVVTHAYEGGHPDHDATAFAVHAALLLGRGFSGAEPTLVEMTSYHDRGGATVRGEFLPLGRAREVTLELTESERKRKRAMLAAYETQRGVLAAFKIDVERFRLAPTYDFGAPPHEGRLHYERFGFAVAGSMWRAFARAAMKKLSLPGGKW
jgi:N-acetylglucosamine malate deacetylase 2